ncbi:MAG: hypothetical protein H5U07_09315 [Candidatus Aminicenantes bacterium]|nr:hypothetical protein [Candidatus Aminicenantes bacterium]
MKDIYSHKHIAGQKAFYKVGQTSQSQSLLICLSFTLVILSLIFSQALIAQENQDKFLVEKLLIYMEPDFGSAEAFAQAIPFVTFVKDREQANIFLEITRKSSDGQEVVKLKFTGQKELAGKDYAVEFSLPLNAEPELLHKKLVRTIKLGLVPYAGRTPEASKLKIRLEEEVKPTAVVDPWNFWVFSLSTNSFLNGEKSFSYDSLYGNFSANRVTPEWKIRLSLSGSYNRNSYNYEDMNFTSSSYGGSFRALVAKSLGEHWSVGSFANVSSSTYQNIKLAASISPAIEYNLFPYSQSTRRQLRITYSLDVGPVYYREETIFDKTKEFLVRENLSLTLELKQKWGTISTSIEGSHYFHDFSKYRLEFNNDLSIRLFQGFSINLYGGYSRIHDLISIAKAGASWEDVLLMRKQLATSYDYYFSVGISYSFGSIYSNVVNPRFGSGGSGFSMHISY